MPRHEPDEADPMELVGVGISTADPEAAGHMARCLAEEFAAMGYAAAEILWLFRNPEHRSAHRAFAVLGEERVNAIIDEAWAVRDRLRRLRSAWESRRGTQQET